MIRVNINEYFTISTSVVDEYTSNLVSNIEVLYEIYDNSNVQLFYGTMVESTVCSGIYNTSLSISTVGNYICYISSNGYPTITESINVSDDAGWITTTISGLQDLVTSDVDSIVESTVVMRSTLVSGVGVALSYFSYFANGMSSIEEDVINAISSYSTNINTNVSGVYNLVESNNTEIFDSLLYIQNALTEAGNSIITQMSGVQDNYYNELYYLIQENSNTSNNIFTIISGTLDNIYSNTETINDTTYNLLPYITELVTSVSNTNLNLLNDYNNLVTLIDNNTELQTSISGLQSIIDYDTNNILESIYNLSVNSDNVELNISTAISGVQNLLENDVNSLITTINEINDNTNTYLVPVVTSISGLKTDITNLSNDSSNSFGSIDSNISTIISDLDNSYNYLTTINNNVANVLLNILRSRNYNISAEDVVRTNTVITDNQTIRNVPYGKTDYIVISVRENGASDWSSPVEVQNVYAWYNVNTSIPYKMGSIT